MGLHGGKGTQLTKRVACPSALFATSLAVCYTSGHPYTSSSPRLVGVAVLTCAPEPSTSRSCVYLANPGKAP